MDKRNLIVLFILLIFTLLLSNFLSITGFVTKENNLIISLNIPPDQQKIKPGENLLLEIAIREVGGALEETTAIDISYEIKDLNDNVISSKQERGLIAVKQSEVTSLLIPTKTKPGVYTASATINYRGNYYTANKTFEVIGREAKISNIVLYALVIFAVLILAFIAIKIRQKKTKKKHGKKHRK